MAGWKTEEMRAEDGLREAKDEIKRLMRISARQSECLAQAMKEKNDLIAKRGLDPLVGDLREKLRQASNNEAYWKTRFDGYMNERKDLFKNIEVYQGQLKQMRAQQDAEKVLGPSLHHYLSVYPKFPTAWDPSSFILRFDSDPKPAPKFEINSKIENVFKPGDGYGIIDSREFKDGKWVYHGRLCKGPNSPWLCGQFVHTEDSLTLYTQRPEPKFRVGQYVMELDSNPNWTSNWSPAPYKIDKRIVKIEKVLEANIANGMKAGNATSNHWYEYTPASHGPLPEVWFRALRSEEV